MLQLNPDGHFHSELLRCLARCRYSGADVSEVLLAASQIKPGDFESWYQVFNQLATRVQSEIPTSLTTSSVTTVRDHSFKAASYYQLADFFLHGNPEDSRINELWTKQTACFDTAISLLPIPGKRVMLEADGFQVPAIFYAASSDPEKRLPTIVMCNGYDGAQEELLHVSGFAALDRGYNVMTYEGPGQPSVRRYQSLGFIPEWEKVVSPVIDYLYTLPNTDKSRIAIYGLSMGGYLAVRAAAKDHRITAALAIDGVYSVYESYTSGLREPLKSFFESGNREAYDSTINKMLSNPSAPTQFRWGTTQGLWSFNTRSAYDFLKLTEPFTLANGVADEVKCQVFIGDAENEQFFKGQAKKAADALGDKATRVLFKVEDGAGEHCGNGAAVKQNGVIFDWLKGVWKE